MRYTSRGNETLCQVAICHGFRHCQWLRQMNASFREREILEAGEEIEVVDIREAMRRAPTTATTEYIRRSVPPPALSFILEQGSGYGLTATGELAGEKRPADDRELTTLAVSNYVSTRGGDGLTANNFPAATVFSYDPLGSADPDHFKLQVCDPEAARRGQAEVRATIYAMRPDYYRFASPTVDYARLNPASLRKPPGTTRQLEVTCRRIPGTSYYRSAYLRLVTTEGAKNGRPDQCLLVTDYFDDATAGYEKAYSEILHQVIQAEYTPLVCQAASHKCTLRARATLDSSRSLHVAVHVTSPAVNLAGLVYPRDVQVCVYRWLRRTLAQAHCRVIMDFHQNVPLPTNMLVVANQSGATRGRTASGRAADGQPSRMSFEVDGARVSVRVHAGDTPQQTAERLAAAIASSSELTGYTARVIRHRQRAPAAAAAGVSDPYDVIVLTPNRLPARVTSARSTDARASGRGPQTLHAVTDYSPGGLFPVGWQDPATEQQRCLRWNFDRPDTLNIYVVSTRISDEFNNRYDGWSPFGGFAGFVTDVGPAVYCDVACIQSNYLTAHEAFHPLAHVSHSNAPQNDAATSTSELMEPTVNWDSAGPDTTSHISDAPIRAAYQLVGAGAGFFPLDGSTALPNPPTDGRPTTPVARLHAVASSYGIIRTGAEPEIAFTITDIPAPPATR